MSGGAPRAGGASSGDRTTATPVRSHRRGRQSRHGPRALVGAIRWDAWVGDLPTSNERGPTAVGHEVERALGPAHWHDRLPFYARELSAHSVEVRATSQD